MIYVYDIFPCAHRQMGRPGAPTSSSPTAATGQKLQVASACNVRRKLILLNRWQFPEKIVWRLGKQLAGQQAFQDQDHGMGVKKC